MDELLGESNEQHDEYNGEIRHVSWLDSGMRRQIKILNLDLSRTIDTPGFFRFFNSWHYKIESLLEEIKLDFGFVSNASIDKDNDLQVIMDWNIEQRDASLVQSPLKLIVKSRSEGESNLYDQTLLETPYCGISAFEGEAKRNNMDKLCYAILVSKLFNLASSVSGRILPRNSKATNSPRFSMSSSSNYSNHSNHSIVQDATIRLLSSRLDDMDESDLDSTTNDRKRDSFTSSRIMSNTHDIYSRDIMSGMRMEAYPDIFYSPLIIVPDDSEQQKTQSYGVYEFFRPHTCSYGILSGSNLHANRVIIKMEDQYIETRIIIYDIREEVKKEFMFKGSFDLENEFQNIVNIFDMFTR